LAEVTGGLQPLRIFAEDLEPLNIDRIEARMRPGAFSESGFLDASERLAEVVERDAAVLARLGVSHEEIADRLERLVCRRLQMENDRSTREIMEHSRTHGWVRGYEVAQGIIAVTPLRYMGHQNCPFESQDGILCGERSSMDSPFYNTVNDKILVVAELALHLIRDHHFFEGSVPYRADPQEILEVIRIGK